MKNYLAALLCTLLFACGSTGTQETVSNEETNELLSPEEMQQDSLFKAMMVIHDEVMPKMDRMYQLRRRAAMLADSLQNQPDLPVPADTLRALARRVEEAEEAMMNWMRSNDFKFEGMEHQEIMRKLEEEKENISVVREEMLSSIEEAEEALAQFDEE